MTSLNETDIPSPIEHLRSIYNESRMEVIHLLEKIEILKQQLIEKDVDIIKKNMFYEDQIKYLKYLLENQNEELYKFREEKREIKEIWIKVFGNCQNISTFPNISNGLCDGTSSSSETSFPTNI